MKNSIVVEMIVMKFKIKQFCFQQKNHNEIKMVLIRICEHLKIKPCKVNE